MKTLPSCCIALLAMIASSWADLETGIALYEEGRYDEAFVQLEPAAKAGEARAQYCVGKMYERGDGTSRDEEAAATWYEKAAAQGDADAQCALGGLYEFGMGVMKSYSKAGELYRQASAQGHEEATRNLRELEKRGLVKAGAPAKPARIPPPAQTPSYQPPAPIDPDTYTSSSAESAALAAYNAHPSAAGLRKISDIRFQHAAQRLDDYFVTTNKASLEEAIAYTDEILEYDPNHTRTHLLLGSLAFLSSLDGQFTGAIAEEHLENVVALDPGNVQARLMLTQLALQQGWYNRALDLYEPLVRDKPDLAIEDHVVLMTAAYLADGQAQRGVDYFKGLAAAHPENQQPLLGQAAVLAGAGRVEEASRVFEQVAQNPDTPDEVRKLAEARLAALSGKESQP